VLSRFLIPRRNHPAHGGFMRPFARFIPVIAGLVMLMNITLSWGQPTCVAPGCNPTQSDVNENTAGGTSAFALSAGASNTAFGLGALEFSSGNFNTGIGARALLANFGSRNTAIGYKALSLSASVSRTTPAATTRR